MVSTNKLLLFILGTTNIIAMEQISVPVTNQASAQFDIFLGKKPAEILKSSRTFQQERDEAKSALEKIINPEIKKFIEENKQDKTAQAIGRSLELLATRIGFFIGNDAPILTQEPLKMGKSWDPVAGLFKVAAMQSYSSMNLLLSKEYFLNESEFLKEKLGEKGDLFNRAFKRSAELLGEDVKELSYILEGKFLSEEEAQKMTHGTDILGHYAAKAEMFEFIGQEIAKTKKTVFEDPEVLAVLEKHALEEQQKKNEAQPDDSCKVQ